MYGLGTPVHQRRCPESPGKSGNVNTSTQDEEGSLTARGDSIYLVTVLSGRDVVRETVSHDESACLLYKLEILKLGISATKTKPMKRLPVVIIVQLCAHKQQEKTISQYGFRDKKP